jgi:hypothetical protein
MKARIEMNQELPEELRRFDESNPAVVLYRIAAASPFEPIIPSFVEMAEYCAQSIEKGIAMWTTKAPSTPGYYWHRKHGEMRVVHVYNSCGLPFDVTYPGTDHVDEADKTGGEFWSEPLLPPK